MKEEKLKYFKGKQIEKIAQKNFENIIKYVQNPILAQLKAFQKTKKEINIKDLF